MQTPRATDLHRITDALRRAGDLLLGYVGRDLATAHKPGAGPVTEADHAVDALLRAALPVGDEGWLSEETADQPGQRLGRRRVWIVDPIDGTQEFVRGSPEWCVSIGLVEDGLPVAGGILNPSRDQLVVGSIETGVTLNGVELSPAPRRRTLAGARVLASDSEVARGEWDRFADEPFVVEGCGSVAYKLGLVAAGKAEATWTLRPKSEWDVAGGAALVIAAGGVVLHLDGTPLALNQRNTRLSGIAAFSACSRGLFEPWFERLWRR